MITESTAENSEQCCLQPTCTLHASQRVFTKLLTADGKTVTVQLQDSALSAQSSELATLLTTARTGLTTRLTVWLGEWVAQSKRTSCGKPNVKNDGAWSPNGWVAVMCQAFCPSRDFSGVKFCADSAKFLGRVYKPRFPCVYACKKLTLAR